MVVLLYVLLMVVFEMIIVQSVVAGAHFHFFLNTVYLLSWTIITV